ncbi:MAG: arylsulfatase [Thalassotalea sp.]
MIKPISVIMLITSLFSPLIAAKTPPNAVKKPNVIVIITDDQGYGDMSVHGNPYLTTKNIDQLAHDSVRLDNFHVDPTCSPTRAALMTGRYATKVGVWLTFGGRNHLYRDEITMADVFHHNNYKTGILGKWHLGDNYPFRPQDRGFDYSFIHKGGVAGETPDYWGNNYFNDTYFENEQPVKTQGYSTDVWFNKAEAFITENQKQPFFLYLATNTPHGPFNVLAKYMQPYLEAGVPEMRARYYGMIQNIDENIARLRSTLTDLNIADNTVILFLTDNGTTAGFEGPSDGYPRSGYNGGMRGRKTSAYEGGHRAAGFLSWPKGQLKQGQVLTNLTSHIDMLPTFVDLLNLQLPKPLAFDGMNLTPLIKQATLEHAPAIKEINSRTIVVHNQARFGKSLGDGLPIKGKDYSVMTNRWRLVGDELYDIVQDPAQKRDIAQQHPQVVAKLQQYYQTWWQDITHNVRNAPTVINTKHQTQVLLSSQAWHGDKVPYDQQHVRSGFQGRGFWDINVETPGHYQITLSRWPKESGLTFSDNFENMKVAGLDTNFRLYNLPAKPFIVKKAALIIDQKQYQQTVAPTDKSITFEVFLSQGVHNLEGIFTSLNGAEYGAYYLYLSAKK